MINFRIIIFLFLFIHLSCTKENDIQKFDLGYNFIPLKVGNSITYQVNQLYWNDFNQTIDTSEYLLKDEVESIFEDLEGRSSFRIERFINIDSTWKFEIAYYQTITNKFFETNILNYRTVNLVFPIAQSISWNGFAYNSNPENFKYSKVHFDTVINSIELDSVITIKQFSDDDGIIERKIGEEKYAKGVGLVYKKWEKIKYKNFELDSGISLTYSIKEYDIQ